MTAIAKASCRKRRTRLRMRRGKGVVLEVDTVELGFLLKRENAIVKILLTIWLSRP